MRISLNIFSFFLSVLIMKIIRGIVSGKFKKSGDYSEMEILK